MNKSTAIILCVVALLLCTSSFARSLDDLLFDATRYGNTPERREAKRVAREELKERMPDSLHAVMAHIHGDRVMLQVLVMEWVLELPSDVIVPVMLANIDHERMETRRAAIFFLGFHQAPEHAARIFPHLEDERTRGAALRTLGKWKVAEARSHAERWLEEGGERLRVVAANALRDIGDPKALPALVKAFDDPVFTVRHTAARAVVSFGDEAAAYLESVESNLALKADLIRQRCLHDLGQSTLSQTTEQGTVVLDGNFFYSE